MSNRALVKLIKYPLYSSDLKSLPNDHAAALGLVSYAVGEICVLFRLYASSPDPSGDIDDDVQVAILTQKLVLMRAISSKLFEFVDFIEQKETFHQTDDEVLRQLFVSTRQSFANMSNGIGYKIARNVRHEATYHYSLKATRKNLSLDLSSSNLDLFPNEPFGNAFYPFGESAVFMLSLKRQLNKLGSEESEQSAIDEWFTWVLGGVNWLRECHTAFLETLIFAHHPGRQAIESVHWVDPRIVGKAGEPTAPVFVRQLQK